MTTKKSFGAMPTGVLLIICLACPAHIAAQTTEATSVAKPTASETVADTLRQDPSQVVGEIVKAADALLATLDETQKQNLMFDFTDNEQRERWSNLPVAMVPRKGLRMGDLSDQQKEAVFGLLRSTLSPAGFQQCIDNMNGDEYLRQNSGGRETSFGRDEYFISILGQPSVVEPWMFQFGGHHLAINATIVESQVTLSPSLTGGQPIDFQWEGKPVRQVASEEDAAYALIDSLTEEQLKQVVLGERYVDLNFGPGAKPIAPKPEGILISSLSAEQQKLARDLINERIGVLNEVHSKIAMEKIASDFSKTYFAWYGPTKFGEPATYRIQGPSALIEYSPQRLGGDATNHIHAMYRDPSNDYGSGFIRNFGGETTK